MNLCKKIKTADQKQIGGIMNRIANNILNAIEARNTAVSADWVSDKRNELKDKTEYETIRWICRSLDSTNKEIAANLIGLPIEYLDKCGEVLVRL